METSNVYQKHLTLDKRIKIEKGIEESKNFSQIGTDICKSAKTVSKLKLFLMKLKETEILSIVLLGLVNSKVVK